VGLRSNGINGKEEGAYELDSSDRNRGEKTTKASLLCLIGIPNLRMEGNGPRGAHQSFWVAAQNGAGPTRKKNKNSKGQVHGFASQKKRRMWPGTRLECSALCDIRKAQKGRVSEMRRTLRSAEKNMEGFLTGGSAKRLTQHVKKLGRECTARGGYLWC